MCGITGFISPDFTKEHLQEMTQALRHRGPDAAGYYFDEDKHIGLGHRRLSILDLSDAANQPFYSSCGRYVMVYNGEIYNFREIKKELPDFPWKTGGDTEVLIEAFAQWGITAISKFNGMFAAAIWDKQTNSLHVFRDRIGIKPLFYYHNGQEFFFASELKALTKLLKKRLTISKQAINHYLHLGYIPQHETIYQEIKKFPAGCSGILDSSGFQIQSFWEATEQVLNSTLKNEAAAKHTLNQLLRDAIDFRMISDVSLGTFLSGGIDSSTVTAIAQDLSDKPVKTFSIGFQEQTHNESQFAEQVAKHLKTEHYPFLLSEKDALEKVEQITHLYDQPFADSSAIPTLLVSEMARKHVTVALSGDGGDEQFMGYGMYQWAKRLANPLAHAGRGFLKTGLSFGNQRMQRAAWLFDYQNKKQVPTHIFSQEQYLFSEKELAEMLNPKFRSSIALEEYVPKSRKLSAAENQAFFDLNHYLKDDLLVKVDIASMYHSLEVRVPLLDHRVVEFSLNLDESLKLKGKSAKYLLKQVLYDYVPAKLFDRPKWGFSIPLGKWLAGELQYLIDQYLSRELVESFGVVNYTYVNQLKQEFLKGKSILYNRLWTLILLHKWWKENQ